MKTTLFLRIMFIYLVKHDKEAQLPVLLGIVFLHIIKQTCFKAALLLIRSMQGHVKPPNEMCGVFLYTTPPKTSSVQVHEGFVDTLKGGALLS